VAAKNRRKLTFKETGSDLSGLLMCFLCLGLIILFVLIGLEIIPSEILFEQLTPTNTGTLFMLAALLYALIPTILVIATIWTVTLQGRLLQKALQAKPRAKRKPMAKIICPGCGRIVPYNWDFCDQCGTATADYEV
jgi:hypothetical protein